MTEHDAGRRRFLRDAIAISAAAALPWHRVSAHASHERERVQSILILGGTGFIGPHLVRRAVERGHRVTIFTRGRRDVDLPASVERLTGDRDGKLEALAGRTWDAVIDDSATNPGWVRQSTELLAPRVRRYLFTSSTGVYYPYLTRGLAESDPVHTEARDPKDGSESFGTRKAQCEVLVQRAFGANGIIVRPTYIVGPGDYTDRFTYWPVRLAQGGDVMAPGTPGDRVQFIDVRDLAAFMLHLVETDGSGIYNAIGPARAPMTMGQFLTRARGAVGRNVKFVWVNDLDLLAKYELDGMVPWILTRGNDLGHTSIVTRRARQAGLSYRPIEDTIKDTLDWFTSLPAERRASAKFVLSAEKEREILDRWRDVRKDG